MNVNGIRSAERKGLFSWLKQQRAQLVCFQEVRAHRSQLDPRIFMPRNWNCFYLDAERKGYSGVGILSRWKPARVVRGLGVDEFDAEARYLELQFPGLGIASLYIPSGTSGERRQRLKMVFLDHLAGHLRSIKSSAREYVICGDFNIAHKRIDLKNWRSNQNNSGFLPEERAWLDELFGPMGYVDAFRVVDPSPERYTWWSNRGRAWEKNVGWRLDYQVVTPGLRNAVRAARIYTRRRFSDHAPLIMDYEWSMKGRAG